MPTADSRPRRLQYPRGRPSGDDPQRPGYRYWAVEGLAYLGTDATIEPLLSTFRDDPSPMIRERAACGLAQSGMLSREQRNQVVPRLIEFAADGALDEQTRGWVSGAPRHYWSISFPRRCRVARLV